MGLKFILLLQKYYFYINIVNIRKWYNLIFIYNYIKLIKFIYLIVVLFIDRIKIINLYLCNFKGFTACDFEYYFRIIFL